MEWQIESQNLISYKTDCFIIRKENVTIGRNEDNDIVIHNEYISRYHLAILMRDGTCWIEDKGSANGSFMCKDNKWQQFHGLIQLELPGMVRLGREVLIKIKIRKEEQSGTKTLILNNTAVGTYRSSIYNIKEWKREQAVMVLDMCESTQLASLDDTMAFHIKKRLEAISNFVLYACNVNFVKNTGDGFIATFTSSADALKAGKGILKNLSVRNQRTDNPSIHVRIGLHRGIIYTLDSATTDVHGNDVNIAFRIEPLQKDSFVKLNQKFPERDRILCSGNFINDLQKQKVFQKLDIVFCGLARLKGIEQPIEIYWIKE